MMQACLRELLFLECKYSFHIRAVYLTTKENRVADYISRYHDDHAIQENFKTVGLSPKQRVDIPLHFYQQWNSW